MVINRSTKTGTTATKTMAFSSCVDVEVGELVAVEAVEVATTDKTTGRCVLSNLVDHFEFIARNQLLCHKIP